MLLQAQSDTNDLSGSKSGLSGFPRNPLYLWIYRINLLHSLYSDYYQWLEQYRITFYNIIRKIEVPVGYHILQDQIWINDIRVFISGITGVTDVQTDICTYLDLHMHSYTYFSLLFEKKFSMTVPLETLPRREKRLYISPNQAQSYECIIHFRIKQFN